MSSGSESDEDFVPGEPEQLSEEESADDETEKQYDNEQEVKAQKRKTNQNTKATKKRKTRNDIKEVVEPKDESEEEGEKALDPEAEKKRQDDLWAMFLDGTDTKPKPKSQENEAKTKEDPSNDKNVPKKEESNDIKEKERRIFEFAGETIVVENNVIKEKIPTASAASKPLVSTSRKPGGGLSSVLGQLNKSNKLSTLEKSKLDWETYKQKEGIQDEIQSHNKGKNGYLDRQDFLQRADQRQYEIERELRMSRRSNR